MVKVLRMCAIAVVGLCAVSCSNGSNSSVNDCTLEVFAASSMSVALTGMAEELRNESGCDISLKFGSSGSLAASIEAGATPDVFLSSGTKSIDSAGLDVSTARAVVESHLAIITKEGTDASRDVSEVTDLLEKRWKLGICAASAPCGELADAVLLNAQDVFREDLEFSREALADTEAISSSDLLTKLEMGELDVVLGYASSCAGNTALKCTPIPDAVNGRTLGEKTTYYLTPVNDSVEAMKLLNHMSSFTFSERLVSGFGFEALS